MQSVNRFIPDAAYRLRAATDAAITADTALPAGELVTPQGAIWDAAVRDGKVVFFLKTFDVFDDDGDETYAIEVITGTNAALSAGVYVHSTHELPEGGEGAEDFWHEIIVDQHSLVKADPDATHFGLRVNVAGTAPSIKVEAYVLPPVGM